MKICIINWCERPSNRSNGFCTMHNMRNKRGTDMNAVPRHPAFKTSDILKTMTEDISSRSRDDCWKWEWYLNEDGYGIVGGKKKGTHFSLELDGFSRPESPNNLALHSCDNKWCWNPDHLRWGSDADNSRDYAERWGYCPHCDHCNQERGEA